MAYKKIGIVLIAIAVLAAGWFIINARHTYSRQYLTNDGVNYSFNFDKSAKEVNISGQSYIEGKELRGSTIIAATAIKTTAPIIKSCSDVGTSWTTAFNSKIMGTDYIVCNANQTIYSTTFEKDGSHYLFQIISKDQQIKLNEENAKSIFDSVSIN